MGDDVGMAISRKGRRRIVVGGRAFYWDYRGVNNRPGVGPRVWMWPSESGWSLVRVVSEDKRWRLTVEMGKAYKGTIDPGGKEFRLSDADFRAMPRSGAITPAFVRQLIEAYFQPPA